MEVGLALGSLMHWLLDLGQIVSPSLALMISSVHGDYASCPVGMSQGPNQNALTNNSKCESEGVLDFFSYLNFFFLKKFFLALSFYSFIVCKGEVIFYSLLKKCFHVYVCFAYVCMCTIHTPGTHEGCKSTLGLLELKL